MKYIKNTWILVFSLFTIVACIALYFGLETYKNEWKTRTIPLPKETKEILCRNFNLDSDHRLCQENEVVYGPDFNEVIGNQFLPGNEQPASYAEVEVALSEFLIECEQVVELADNSYFRCFFDLSGDGEFRTAIYFDYPTMTVRRIHTHMGYD